MRQEKDSKKVKKDMMELWKYTFHDSFRYIKLVFDTYFKPDNVFYVYDGEKLIAALLGVEYDFQILDECNQVKTFKGMYLCGLATHPAYRKRGVMTELMKEAEVSAKVRGFDISFLIPASDHLREYYQKKGYITTSYKLSQTLKSVKMKSSNGMNIYTFQAFFERGKDGFLRDMANWCRERERPNDRYVTLRHSEEDFLTILSENENSFFLTDCSFDPEYPILAKVAAVVLPTTYDKKNIRWSIVGFYLKDNDKCDLSSDNEFKIPEEITDAIIKASSDSCVELNLPYTGTDRRVGEPYAMVKILSENENIKKYENLTYKISLMLD